MSSVMHPRGPESAQTYWVRRAIVIVAAVIVLALLGWGISKLVGGSGQGTTATPGAIGSTASTQTSGSSTGTQPGSSSSTSPAVTTSMDPAAASAQAAASSALAGTEHLGCDPKLIALAVTGQTSVKTGSPTQISVTFTNTSDYSCILNFASNPFELRIYSGADRIWTTNDCAQWLPASPMAIASHGTVKYTVTWPTLRSKGGCGIRSDYLKPGTYVARAQVSGGVAKELVMKLHG